MSTIEYLSEQLQQRFGEKIQFSAIAQDQLTIEILCGDAKEIFLALRDEAPFQFDQLMDICGVDYLYYGMSQWETENTTFTGFGRAVEPFLLGARAARPQGLRSNPSQTSGLSADEPSALPGRFAVVYHLLSLPLNQRVRVRILAEAETPCVNSVIDIWPSANWFEREAFDLYGIVFDGHSDLRRILTDYGFVGHPFRKDFPLIGEVEMRYDAEAQRCIYEPVSIQPRTLVPKVIRKDARYVRPA